jgi:ankyrin repeat protein
MNGHDSVVKLLLQNGADVHADNDCALQLSSKNGHDIVVKLLLGNGANFLFNEPSYNISSFGNDTKRIHGIPSDYS